MRWTMGDNVRATPFQAAANGNNNVKVNWTSARGSGTISTHLRFWASMPHPGPLNGCGRGMGTQPCCIPAAGSLASELPSGATWVHPPKALAPESGRSWLS